MECREGKICVRLGRQSVHRWRYDSECLTRFLRQNSQVEIRGGFFDVWAYVWSGRPRRWWYPQTCDWADSIWPELTYRRAISETRSHDISWTSHTKTIHAVTLSRLGKLVVVPLWVSRMSWGANSYEGASYILHQLNVCGAAPPW